MGFFSKKTCANCGKEAGLMDRNKISSEKGTDKQYICNECKREVSVFFKDYHKCNIDEIKEHIAYMKEQEDLYQKIFLKSNYSDYRNDRLGAYFADEIGMFHVKNPKNETFKNNHDIFRYDQIGKYEVFEEYERSSDGKSEELKEVGVIIYMNSERGNIVNMNNEIVQGQLSHPFVSELKIVTGNKGEKDAGRGQSVANNIIVHINSLFGIETDGKALIKIGLSKAEKKNIEENTKAGVAALKGLAALARGVKKGDIESEQEAISDAIDAVNDRMSQGRITYGKLADQAVARLHDIEN